MPHAGDGDLELLTHNIKRTKAIYESLQTIRRAYRNQASQLYKGGFYNSMFLTAIAVTEVRYWKFGVRM
jgi:hypothetical protein